MSVKLGKITHIDDFDEINFDFVEMKDILENAEVIDSSIYYDRKTKTMFVYLNVTNYKEYISTSKKYSDMWWSDLIPIKDMDLDENAIDYAWHDVFHIKDDN